jgi:phosphotransferase system enzyme I (PtsI)
VTLKGTGVSPGIAVGHALLMEREAVPIFRLLLPPEAVEAEVQRLSQAVALSRQQLQRIKERLSKEVGVPHAYIFDAQLLMLEDPLLLDRSVAVIRDEHVNAGWALRTVSDQLHALFGEFSDDYLKERSTDLDDVLGRIQLNLGGAEGAPSLSRLPGPFVLVAEDLTPSEAAELDWGQVLAVAIDAGSKTYHSAILARSLAIPAVVGLKEATRRIPPGALVVVDGTRGDVVVEPSQPTLEGYRVRQESDRQEDRRLRGTRELPTVTLDGVRVRLQANVEFADEAATGVLYGAEGIGLFRSEFLLGQARRWPAEERQLDLYRRLLEQVRPHPVTVRTWDVEADVLVPGGPSIHNPALGERASRLMRRCPEPFRVQIRALLRAALHGPLRIMLPFVSGPADARWALDLIEQERQSLRQQGTPFGDDVPVGINVEVPSAAATADLLARDVDFFSIGTNDLIQYLLAVDRADPRVAPLYEPLHPAVLRTIRSVVKAAAEQSLPLSVCGEMATDPVAALVLVGLGVRELSMTPSAIPRVKAALRAVSASRAAQVAERCLGLATAGEIEETLRHDLADALASVDSAKE